MTRRVALVTVGRSDYGIFLPLIRRIQTDDDFQLLLIVAGAHLLREFGSSFEAIEKDGIPISARVHMMLASDVPEAISKSVGLGVIEFSTVYSRLAPEILVLLGDRFEMLAAGIASLPFNIPIAHIHGGESSEGAIDESIRHALTKISHLHFPSIELHGKRIIQMGEEPWRVTVCGALSLDNLSDFRPLEGKWFLQHYGIDIDKKFLLVTFHPATLDYQNTNLYFSELLAALGEFAFDIVLTFPNADTHSRGIIEQARNWANGRDNVFLVQNLGVQAYFSLMTHAVAMVGNSSSGILEAASFKLPVLDIGIRQKGRYHEANVLHVGNTREEIIRGIRQAVSPEFKMSLANLVNPYGNGGASSQILERLRSVPLNRELIQKRFYMAGVTTASHDLKESDAALQERR